MKKNKFTFLAGGQAGQGVKKAGAVASLLFRKLGRKVFELEDYQSLIRGGHNFAAVSSSTGEISSHYMKADLVVAFDERSYKTHKGHLSKDGLIIYDDSVEKPENGIAIPLLEKAKDYSRANLRLGVGSIAVLCAYCGLGKEFLDEIIEEGYGVDLDNNKEYAHTIYDIAEEKIEEKIELENGEHDLPIIDGNKAIALGAKAAGLDSYFAYPMSPASPILHFLAKNKDEMAVSVVHAESELAVINMAIGSSFTGARTLVGTSGGGFALMAEGYSFAGIAEAPVLVAMASRPGPATGVPTYTAQGDLKFVLDQGHGEFTNIVASPGTIEEAFYLASEMMQLIWEFQMPGILLSEKHLAESSMSVSLDSKKTGWAEPSADKESSDEDYQRYSDTEDGISPLRFPPSKSFIRWNSYTHDKDGITTEDAETITWNANKLNRKTNALIKKLKSKKTVNVYGDSGPIIFTYGSVTMSVLEALRCGNLEATIVQPIYLDPLPIWELEKYRDKDVLFIEQSSTGLFEQLLKEKAGIKARDSIRKYDGRPFDPEELAAKIQEVIK
ncbi:MAG: 2-oxoacid:acceptor oxidoreductase family protein [Candidatus Zixiibacteriota bacterium]